MANQIAANFATMGDVDAAAATADHIATFWEPRMRATLLCDGSGLSALAAQAVEALRCDLRPPHVTPATHFTRSANERSDAG